MSALHLTDGVDFFHGVGMIVCVQAYATLAT
jgi:hypothetical protein